MAIKKWITAIIGCSLTLGAMADTTEKYHPWSFIGSLGYTWYNDFYDGVQLLIFLRKKPSAMVKRLWDDLLLLEI